VTSPPRRLQARPFRALRYAPPGEVAIDRLIAPPYDVISGPQREQLAAEPHNIVHLDLPAPAPGADPYAGAAKRLRDWIREGVLIRDPHLAFYVCEQDYRTPEGAARRRRGLFARLTLEPFDSGVVIPHERTLERPRLDRLRLLEATRTHLSAVFLLHHDPGGRVASLLGELDGGPPLLRARDGEGNPIRLFRVQEPSRMARLEALLRDQWALVADGHHRYESALAYRDARRARGVPDAEHVLALLCSLEDEGLSILPIHRLVHSLPDFSAARARAALATFFSLQEVASPQGLVAAVRGARGQPGVFGLLFGNDGGAFLARWKPGAGLDRPGVRAVPELLRRLDVILLHRLVLEEVLGIDLEAQARQTHLEYVKDDGHLLKAARQAQIGVLLNPTRIEQVVEVSRAGLRLPQKTTYFYPKVPSGLVLDPLDD